MELKQQDLRRRLAGLGFDDVRFASVPVDPGASPEVRAAVEHWLNSGMQADMAWMDRTRDKRLSPDLVLPGVKSIIMLGVSYWHEDLRGRPGPDASSATWARYALYEDYHDTIKPALVAAGRLLEGMYGATSQDYRYYVDTGPVLERNWASRSGLGFIGKNAMLISREHGNWLFLAAILTRLSFTADAPVARPPERTEIGLLCGTCTRCLSACPTEAFPAPGVVDARLCISYQTIENKGIIPRELRAGIGNRIYGCDVCLEVCPWNRFARNGRQMLLSARHDLAALTLSDLLCLTPVRFAEVFRHTPIKRLKLIGLLRNACVVAGNSGDTTLLPQLAQLASGHESPVIRVHAVWAVFQLGGGDRLAAARAAETDPSVQSEYAAAAASRSPLAGSKPGL